MKPSKLKSGTSVIETAHPFEGLPNGDERLAKVKLAGQIKERIKERSLKQQEAADLLDITQPEVSNLNKGRLSGFTFDRLYRCLNALNMDIEISISPINWTLANAHNFPGTDDTAVNLQWTPERIITNIRVDITVLSLFINNNIRSEKIIYWGKNVAQSSKHGRERKWRLFLLYS